MPENYFPVLLFVIVGISVGLVPIALGGGISVLLFVLVSFLISRRERAEEMAQGMTESIRTNEERLRLSEMRIRAIVDGADHLIISTNPEGIIQSFNHAAERQLGYRAEELVAQGVSAVKVILSSLCACCTPAVLRFSRIIWGKDCLAPYSALSSFRVSINLTSNILVNCDLGSAHGARTCFTPSLGQFVRGRPA